jgi:hypothetical protein
VTVGDKKRHVRSVGMKLLATVTVGDKKRGVLLATDSMQAVGRRPKGLCRHSADSRQEGGGGLDAALDCPGEGAKAELRKGEVEVVQVI